MEPAALKQSQIRQTGLKISRLSFGAAGLGNMPLSYGYDVDEERAQQTLDAIFGSDVNLLDTSRNYGFGRSEERIGEAIMARGGLPDGFLISTKIDRDLETNRLDSYRARRSIEASLAALSLDHVPILHLHDPEHVADIEQVTSRGGALDELFRIREEGLTTAVGLAMGEVGLMRRLLENWDFDVVITHNRYSLLNRNANDLIEYAASRGIAVINAAPFASGILATGSKKPGRIVYSEATPEAIANVVRLEGLCASYKIPLPAAALQFSMRDPRITSTLVGVTRPERVTSAIQLADIEIPSSFWDEVETFAYATNDPEAERDYKLG